MKVLVTGGCGFLGSNIAASYLDQGESVFIIDALFRQGSDINLAWPSSEIAVMGPEGAINILKRKELANAEDPQTLRTELVDEYRATHANPYVAASYGFVDDVIEPSQSRPRLINALEMLQNKRDENPPKKHGNIPL